MKRTYADRPNWTRVVEKRFMLAYIKDKDYTGYMAIIYLDKVCEPLFVGEGEKKLCLANDGFIWTQYFPKDRNYALTTQFDEKQEIIQLYFDICDGNKISSSGIPYYDDLYLDVVLLPSGEVLLLDEDELKQALEDKVISKEKYDLAYNEAKVLIDYIENNKNWLLNSNINYLKYMVTLKE
ncbi:DUF402 domain-containing protein [Proteiniborus sp. MB09-C3]|uniref:DUF402 domain-containing protein n=1 Tax=Proteiniborus sp. MB09-C3 TaxID=3050072 RepID=UPI0025563173|nr:DUF402 domain-containing protein [Proteiniborus sp. MB09-C3]WIV11553.1 DUF402 domain-containing protein [Proteiniborus sp. MB09-C3]